MITCPSDSITSFCQLMKFLGIFIKFIAEHWLWEIIIGIILVIIFAVLKFLKFFENL